MYGTITVHIRSLIRPRRRRKLTLSDIIDGFGSYTDRFMKCAVFRGIGGIAYKYYCKETLVRSLKVLVK